MFYSKRYNKIANIVYKNQNKEYKKGDLVSLPKLYHASGEEPKLFTNYYGIILSFYEAKINCEEIGGYPNEAIVYKRYKVLVGTESMDLLPKYFLNE